MTYNFLQAKRRRHLAGPTFPAAHAIMQEIFTAFTVLPRRSYPLHRACFQGLDRSFSAPFDSDPFFEPKHQSPLTADRAPPSGSWPKDSGRAE